jgi:SAM-dependent methyltransferase
MSLPAEAKIELTSHRLACGSDRSVSIPYPMPRNPLFRDLRIELCRDCGLGAVRKSIKPEKLRQYYVSEYAGHAGRHAAPAPENYFSDTAVMFKPKRSLSQLRLAKGSLAAAPKRILDLGAGFGTTLFLARRDFWPQAELIAIEPDRSMSSYLSAAGCCQVLSIDDVEPRSCDLIIASHVLEHYQADEIGDVLAQLRLLLARRGTLLVEVPNSDFSDDPTIAAHSHEPHLLFFSKKALGSLLTRHGFKVTFLASAGPQRRRGVMDRVMARFRRLIGWPLTEYGGDRAALRLLAQAGEDEET